MHILLLFAKVVDLKIHLTKKVVLFPPGVCFSFQIGLQGDLVVSSCSFQKHNLPSYLYDVLNAQYKIVAMRRISKAVLPKYLRAVSGTNVYFFADTDW